MKSSYSDLYLFYFMFNEYYNYFKQCKIYPNKSVNLHNVEQYIFMFSAFLESTYIKLVYVCPPKPRIKCILQKQECNNSGKSNNPE